MASLYHIVPASMQGSILYPLNQLRDINPALYDAQAAKYVGREYIMNKTIPYFDCLWNDVLFLTAQHPKKLQEALLRAGGPKLSHSFFEIDASSLEPRKSLIYLFANTTARQPLTSEDFAPFVASNLEKYNIVPKATEEYFSQQYKQKKRPLLYYKVPHVLYHGTLDISNAKIITI